MDVRTAVGERDTGGGISVTFRRRLVEISLCPDSIKAELSVQGREERGRKSQAGDICTLQLPRLIPLANRQFSVAQDLDHSQFAKVESVYGSRYPESKYQIWVSFSL